VINAALHGQGIALGRMTLAEQYIKSKQLVGLFGQSQKVKRAFHAIVAPGAEKRAEVKQFVEWLQRELKD
jgi:LysR family glycine cleavage system transcriptional activator